MWGWLSFPLRLCSRCLPLVEVMQARNIRSRALLVNSKNPHLVAWATLRGIPKQNFSSEGTCPQQPPAALFGVSDVMRLDCTGANQWLPMIAQRLRIGGGASVVAKPMPWAFGEAFSVAATHLAEL
jgi:hypothetical protein